MQHYTIVRMTRCEVHRWAGEGIVLLEVVVVEEEEVIHSSVDMEDS